jgi:hypothetical protein
VHAGVRPPAEAEPAASAATRAARGIKRRTMSA